jgi:hypothetical protein
MRKLLFSLFILLTTQSIGQINLTGSTVQVIGYWDKKETMTYTITDEKFKVTGIDTTKTQSITYDVIVTILDSSAKSYKIDWFYKNYAIDSDNEMLKKLTAMSEDMHVIIKTDEMGTFVEVVNWKEIRDYINKVVSNLKNEYKDIPKMDAVFDQLTKMYSTKEAIESFSIKDIQQFYFFYGGKYDIGVDNEVKTQLPNPYGEKPFDSEITILLDEVDTINDNSVIRMWQNVDPKQLTDAAYDYMKKIATSLGTEAPARASIADFSNETTISSRIHGSTGWVIYSIETKEISDDKSTNIEERIIELK